ncbi:3623_t:CDS:2, partial [Funneliformis geosporum]
RYRIFNNPDDIVELVGPIRNSMVAVDCATLAYSAFTTLFTSLISIPLTTPGTFTDSWKDFNHVVH